MPGEVMAVVGGFVVFVYTCMGPLVGLSSKTTVGHPDRGR